MDHSRQLHRPGSGACGQGISGSPGRLRNEGGFDAEEDSAVVGRDEGADDFGDAVVRDHLAGGVGPGFEIGGILRCEGDEAGISQEAAEPERAFAAGRDPFTGGDFAGCERISAKAEFVEIGLTILIRIREGAADVGIGELFGTEKAGGPGVVARGAVLEKADVIDETAAAVGGGAGGNLCAPHQIVRDGSEDDGGALPDAG